MDFTTSHSIRKKRNFKGVNLTVDPPSQVNDDNKTSTAPALALSDLNLGGLYGTMKGGGGGGGGRGQPGDRLSTASSLLSGSSNSSGSKRGDSSDGTAGGGGGGGACDEDGRVVDSRRTSTASTVSTTAGSSSRLGDPATLGYASVNRSKSGEYDIGQTITASAYRRGSASRDGGGGGGVTTGHMESAIDELAHLYLDNGENGGPVRSHSSLSTRSTDREVMGVNEEEMVELGDIGRGNGGVVTKVRHEPTGRIMACKMVVIDNKPEVIKQIKRELEILHRCSSAHIVTFYGHVVRETKVFMYLEYMDRGSLDVISRRHGALDVSILGQIVVAVLEGLIYLYDERRIMHRDVKPSNILVNSKGQIKLCDFGVSGELVNSIADTFVGTSTYMSPERIRGNNQYGVNSDIWSLGIALVELGTGGFPYSATPDSDNDDEEERLPPSRNKKPVVRPTLSILELLQTIIHEPAPRLPSSFPADAVNFVDRCLIKDPDSRPSPKDLLRHPFYISAKSDKVDLAAWATSI